MRRQDKGFSIIELLMVMFIMGFVIAMGSDMVVGLLRGYKQQSKISETNIEGIIGLEMLRRDIESAGYGLPWIIPPGTTYQEALNAPASGYNDSTANAPRALLSGFDGNGRAYLVVKALNLGNNDACTKWTTLFISGGTPTTTSWDPSTENLSDSDRVIVLSPGATTANSRSLVGPSGSPISLLQQSDAVAGLADVSETRIVYGVDGASANPLRMPFNRADYYVSTTAVPVPGRCASGTGVLVKSIINQTDGGLTTLPLLDCVADMQVVTYLDTDGDGAWETASNGLVSAASSTAAQTIRDQLKEVHVFILAHEGQLDTSYTHATNPMLVGETAALGRNFDLAAAGITNWQNYRWKVYTLIMVPKNLR